MIFPHRRRKNAEIRAALPALTGLRSGQRLPPLGTLPFGCSTVAFSGCETLAMHNLLVLLGKGLPYAEVLAVAERQSWLLGWFGVSPRRVGSCLRRLGVPVCRTRATVRLTEALRSGKPVVFSYWTRRPLLSPIHTVCLCGNGDGCRVYNLYSNQAEPADFPLPQDFFALHRRILGYYPA